MVAGPRRVEHLAHDDVPGADGLEIASNVPGTDSRPTIGPEAFICRPFGDEGQSWSKDRRGLLAQCDRSRRGIRLVRAHQPGARGRCLSEVRN